ncbi:MAG: ATP-binding protein [Candidatus Eisenbacteria bacterium]
MSGSGEPKRHHLLERQMRRHLRDRPDLGDLEPFLQAVSEAYAELDEEKAHIERAMELSSRDLLRANHEIRAVLAALPDLILEIDANDRILGCKSFGTDGILTGRPNLIGRPVTELPFAGSIGQIRSGVDLVRATRRPISFDFRSDDGATEEIYEARIIPVDLGEVTLMLIRDITFRRRTEDALRSQEALMRTILDSAREGIWGVDRNGATVFVNRSAAQLVGWEVSDLIGRNIHEMLESQSDGDDAAMIPAHQESTCPICRALATGTPEPVRRETFRRRHGDPFPAQCSVNPTYLEGEVAGAVVTFNDVTEQLRLETQLLQAQKLESIGQLAAGIAHEINTPTQYLTDNIYFLRDSFQSLREFVDSCRVSESPEEPRVAEGAENAASGTTAPVPDADIDFLLTEIPLAIDQSLEGLSRVSTIVRAMKEFSHPGTHEKVPVDLNQAIRNTVTVSRNEWKYVATLDLDLDPELPLVPCYVVDLNQVFLNLIVNAAHALETRGKGARDAMGHIRVTSRSADGWAEIQVADDGCGIPAHQLGKIFDPFFTTKAVGKGTGQGLAIAHSVVVSKHEGTIDVRSEVGRGTTYTVRIPLALPEARAA